MERVKVEDGIYTIRLNGCTGAGKTYGEAKDNLQKALINQGIMYPELNKEKVILSSKDGRIIERTTC